MSWDREDADFGYEVLKLCYEADIGEDLLWYVGGDGGIGWALQCSDTFIYACADAEDVTSEDLPLLRQCIADLKGEGQWGVAVLYAARKRNERPLPAWRVDDDESPLGRLLRELPPNRCTELRSKTDGP